MDINVDLKGADKLQRLFKSLDDDELKEGLGQAMVMTAEDVLNKSKKLVPVDTGALLASGRVDKARIYNDGRIEVEMSYGGAAAPYAVIVHEDMRDKNWSKPGTGPKYLERPFLESAPYFVSNVKRRFAAFLRQRAAGG